MPTSPATRLGFLGRRRRRAPRRSSLPASTSWPRPPRSSPPTRPCLLPELRAGCPMADMVTGDGLRAWKADHPGVPVVTYVNSSAEVKAESDVCVTSANAVAVVRALGADKILFAPDRNLGSWVARSLPDVEVVLWDGWCPTHDEVTAEQVAAARAEHPARQDHDPSGVSARCRRSGRCGALHVADACVRRTGCCGRVHRRHGGRARSRVAKGRTGQGVLSNSRPACCAPT